MTASSECGQFFAAPINAGLDRLASRFGTRIVMAKRQVVEIDMVAIRFQNRALDCMPELADITGPLIAAQRVQCGARNLLYVLAEEAVEMFK